MAFILGLSLAGCATQPQPGVLPVPGPARMELSAAGTAELPIARFHERTQGYFRFNSGVPSELMAAIRSDEDWRVQWGLASAHFGSPPPEPEVDFEKDMLLIAAMGSRGSGGYSIHIERVVERPDELVANVRFTSPAARCGAIAVITSPADIVRVPKSEKNVRWQVERVSRDCS